MSSCSSPMRVAVFSGLSALLFVQVIRAQSQETPQTCAPSCLSSDAFKEMTGKKVYPKIIIDDVKFDGPVHLPNSSKELEVISELKRHEFDAGSDWLNEILEVPIRLAWQDEGFFKVMPSGETQVVSEDSLYEHVVITIHINAGLQYRLGDVRFRVLDEAEPLVFPQEELRKLIPLQEGDLISVSKIREGFNALFKFYGSNGYIEYATVPESEVDDVTQRISLVLGLQQNKQFRVGKVEVFGLKANKAAVLTSALKPGDVFNRSIVDAFIEANLPDLPKVASRHVLGLHKDFEKGTVDIVVDFRAWPKQREF